MLRNSFMKRYKPSNQNSIDTHYISKEEDEYLINKTRPIGDKQIKTIPHKLLYNFVEDLLTDHKLTSVIYSSNTKNEIEYFKQSNRASARASVNTSHTNSKKKEMTTTSRNEFRNQFDLIKEHINSYKLSKKERINSLNQKNGIFFKGLQMQKRFNINDGNNSINNIRRQNLNRTIQRCKSHLANKPTFELPDVELHLRNVYSRLYHNSIFIDHSSSSKVKKLKINKSSKKKDDKKDNKPNKPIKKLNLKYVINTNKGNAGFASKVTNSIFNRCLFKHSGGPISNREKSLIKSIDDNNDSNDQQYISIKQLKDNKQNTYLHDAVLDSSVKFVKYYLAKNLSPNEQNVFGDTPLHYAMKIDNMEIIKLLLDSKGNIYIQNAEKETPYDKASIEVRRLLKLEGRINERYNNKGK